MTPVAEGKKQFLWCEIVYRVRQISHNLTCPPSSPGGVKVLEELQIEGNNLLGTVKDALQSALSL